MIKEQKIFDEFIKNLDLAFMQFYVWKSLRNQAFNTVYSKDRLFWVSIEDSLLNSFSVGLAKLVEKKGRPDRDVLSIFYLIEKSEFKNSDETIEKMQKLRNKFLVHNDIATCLNVETFLSDLGLKFKDMEKLFNEIIDVLEKIKHKFGDSTDLRNRYKEIEKGCAKDTISIMDQLIPGIEL